MTSTLRFNARLLFVVLALLVGLQLFFPHRAWVTLLVGLGGAWLIAYLWARALARGLAFTRERRFGLAQVGDSVEERFTVTNNQPWPALWFELLDDSNLPGYNVSRAMGVSGYAKAQWTTTGVCERRGQFHLGPVTLRTGDPFGLYTVTFTYPNTMPVFVMPPVVPLPAIQVAPGGRAGEGRPQRRALERTVTAATTRQYVPGDDLRWIHWPTSARQNALHVRLLENTPAGDWWIYLDLDQAVQAGQGSASTLEHGILLAASLASQGLGTGQAVGLVAHGESLLQLAPYTGNGQRLNLMRALAVAQPGPLPFANLLTNVQPALRELASLILITPAVSGTWIEALLPLLWRGAVPTVLLLDPASYGLAGQPQPALAELARLGIQHFVITPQLLDQPEAHPGQRGLHWRVSPSGRAILTTQADELEWKAS